MEPLAGCRLTTQLSCQHLQRLSGISSRLLLAAMNSSRLVSLPMPEGSPSKSSLLEFRYNFFSFVSLQMADWRGGHQLEQNLALLPSPPSVPGTGSQAGR